MKIVSETSLYNFDAWSGGKDTLDTLISNLSSSELNSLECQIEDALGDEITDTELNDFLWFETDTIAEMLGYRDWEDFMCGSEEEEEEEEEEEDDDSDEDDEE